MKHIAIIPARSGSKGLPDKNIKSLNGTPMIAYTIKAAVESGIYDEIMVSTDSVVYAKIAKEYGANVPFLRGESLSNDSASSWDVVRDVLTNYENMGEHFDTVTLLQPTSPLRQANDIKNSYSIFLEKNAHSVVSVCEVEHSPHLCNTLGASLSMDGFIKEHHTGPRQQYAPQYRINGAIYMVNAEYIKANSHLYTEGCYAYRMPKERSIDIDDHMDFMIAQTILETME